MDNNKIYTVMEFVEEYNNIKSNAYKVDDETKKLVKSVIKDTYVSYENKINSCERILEHSCYVHKNGKKLFKVNSPLRYVLFIINLLQRYTTLKLNASDVFKDFNLLNENGLINLIVANISKQEYLEFKLILDMMLNDLVSDRKDILSYIQNEFSLLDMIFGDEKFIKEIKEKFAGKQNEN